ncbi:hypothetical protein FOZ62_009365, partial [Perkinsus olseni]
IPALLSLAAATHRGLQSLSEWDSYCRALNGATSFCIRTQLLGDFCAFGNEGCGSGTIPPYTTTPATTQHPITPESSTISPASTTTTITVTTLPLSAWDDFCRSLNGPSSFCLSTTLLGNFCAFGPHELLNYSHGVPFHDDGNAIHISHFHYALICVKHTDVHAAYNSARLVAVSCLPVRQSAVWISRGLPPKYPYANGRSAEHFSHSYREES